MIYTIIVIAESIAMVWLCYILLPQIKRAIKDIYNEFKYYNDEN